MYFKLSNNFYKNIIYNGKNIEISDNINFEFIPILHIKLLCFDDASCRLKIEIVGMNILSIT
jgi:hypothetical protein